MKKPLLFWLALMFAAFSFAQKNAGKNPFDNALYARLGYALPGGDLKTGNILTAGAQFEVGNIFYINALKSPEKLKLGIDATYLSLSGFVNQDSLSANDETNSYFTVGVKIGPCVSYNIAGQWIADAYFKLEPKYFITGQKGIYDAATQFKLGTSFGLNIRYRAVMLGCEFSSAKYDFDVISTTVKAVEVTTAQSVRLPVTVLSLGVNF
jgi:hypothetical protein